jgi:prolipoprotein diacylglyceryltransferase
LWCTFAAIILVTYLKRFTLQPGSIFALYVALYSLGRGFIETLRIDQANLLWGVRLNVWTSMILFIASLAYLRHINVRRGSAID